MNDETFDATTLTLKILSCVYRAQQQYGTPLIAETLHGSKSKHIFEFGLNKLSTYGIVTDYSILQIQAVIDELIKEGYLYRSTAHQEIKLAPGGKQFLKKKPQFFLPKQLLEDAQSPLFSPKLTPFHAQIQTLWERGATVEEIAALQKKAVSTISDKIVDWDRILSRDLFSSIENLLKNNMSGKLRDVKSQLPEHVSWTQIKVVLASLHL